MIFVIDHLENFYKKLRFWRRAVGFINVFQNKTLKLAQNYFLESIVDYRCLNHLTHDK